MRDKQLAAKSQRERYHANPDRYKARARLYRSKLKQELFAAYGNKCSCCGETEQAFLTLEHANRDGKAHRAALSQGKNNSWSASVYADLRRRGYPQDAYTLLCFNCNHATWKLGNCPHKEGIWLSEFY